MQTISKICENQRSLIEWKVNPQVNPHLKRNGINSTLSSCPIAYFNQLFKQQLTHDRNLRLDEYLDQLFIILNNEFPSEKLESLWTVVQP
jgi:hypothetical protein